MASELTLTYADYGGGPNNRAEKATVKIEGEDLTAQNFDAQMTLADTLRGAIEAVMIDPSRAREVRGNVVSEDNSAQSTNPLNQREIKWLVRASDDVTGEILRREIPGANLTLLDPDNRGYMDISAGDGAALVAALEAFWRNPRTGNSVTVLDVKMVGRNV